MDVKRVILWLLFPYVMVFVDWKNANVFLKVYGLFSAGIIFLSLILAVTTDQSTIKKPTPNIEIKKEPAKPKVVKENQIYPLRILKAINDLEISKEPKKTRYVLFDQEVGKVIPYKPSDKDLKFYTKFVLNDYEKISLDYIQGLSDSDLLKIIYRNRPVDLYFAYREIYDSPLGGVAYNIIQIAREQYEGTLTPKLYDVYKQTLDGHYKNM
jgi:hypothetical protein